MTVCLWRSSLMLLLGYIFLRRIDAFPCLGLLDLDGRLQSVSPRPRARSNGHLPGALAHFAQLTLANGFGFRRTGSTGPGRRFPRRPTFRTSRQTRSGPIRSGSRRAGFRPIRARLRASASPTRSSIRRRPARPSRSVRSLVRRTAGRSASRLRARRGCHTVASSAA